MTSLNHETLEKKLLMVKTLTTSLNHKGLLLTVKTPTTSLIHRIIPKEKFVKKFN